MALFHFFVFSIAASVDLELELNISRSQYNRARQVALYLFDEDSTDHFSNTAELIVAGRRAHRNKYLYLTKLRHRLMTVECFVSKRHRFTFMDVLLGLPNVERRSYGLRQASCHVLDAAVSGADAYCKSIYPASRLVCQSTLAAVVTLQAERAAMQVVEQYRARLLVIEKLRNRDRLKKKIVSLSALLTFGYVVIFERQVLCYIFPACLQVASVIISLICSSLITLSLAWSVCRLVS